MLDLVDRLARLNVTATSPDGNLCAIMDSERHARFWFQHEEAFDDYSAESLAAEVTALVRGLSSGLRRGIEAAYRAEGREYSVDDEPDWNAAWRRYHEAAEKIEPLGISSSGLVALSATAELRSYLADVDEDSFGDVSPDEFVRELHEAYRDLLADLRRQRRELRYEYIGR